MNTPIRLIKINKTNRIKFENKIIKYNSTKNTIKIITNKQGIPWINWAPTLEVTEW